MPILYGILCTILYFLNIFLSILLFFSIKFTVLGTKYGSIRTISLFSEGDTPMYWFRICSVAANHDHMASGNTN